MYLKSILVIIFYVSFSISNAVEYKISLIGSESINATQWIIKGINDKGQVFGGFSDGQKQIVFISENNGLFSFIEEENHTYSGNYLIANNNGLLVGAWNGGPGNNNFIWSKVLGIRSLNIFNTINIHPIALNDLGQLIGTYYEYLPKYEDRKHRPFLWDNGIVKDMGEGSEFAKKFEELGYPVLDIHLTSINNKGELAGYFCYGKFNEKKQKIVKAGYKPFFWNGDLHLIQLPSDAECPNLIKVNYHGAVLINLSNGLEAPDIVTTYLWNVENGLEPLFCFHGKSINNNLTVLGFLKKYKFGGEYEIIPAIWKDGCCSTLAELLGVESLDHISPAYSDTYSVERIRDVIDINNKEQIVCEGLIWGEWCPCLLELNTK